ncbi:MAG: TlpA disulfide reductase family protein [Planctomycetota bacterium]
MAAELLKLEETYRGESAALNALRLAMDWTHHQTNPWAKTTHQEAVNRLREHYLTHSELDNVMSGLSFHFDLKDSIDFLDLVEKASPHSQVRASALLYQMIFLAKRVDTRNAYEQRNWKVLGLENRSLEDQLAYRQLVDGFKEMDPEKVRNQIVEIGNRLKSEFGKSKRQGFVSTIQSFNLRRHQPDDMEEFGALADRILFRVSRLQPGEIVEDFEGEGINGKKFRLQDFRGKVVMLMFSANWCGLCKAIYPENRELVIAYKDRPFQMISVRADQKAERRQSIRATSIG